MNENWVAKVLALIGNNNFAEAYQAVQQGVEQAANKWGDEKKIKELMLAALENTCPTFLISVLNVYLRLIYLECKGKQMDGTSPVYDPYESGYWDEWLVDFGIKEAPHPQD